MRMKSVLLAALVGLLAWTDTGWAAADEGPSAKCLMCHSAVYEKMARTRHMAAADSRTFGCIGCHGSSSDHADNPVEKRPDQVFKGKGAIDAGAATEVCLACHVSATPKPMMLWAGSAHPQSGVACNDCHQVHVDKEKVFNKAEQPSVCYACHKEQRVLGNRPFRHPVQEGKVTCSDCHSAHGSAGPKLARRDTINTTCYTCHAEKRGPFVQNHEPVQDNCATCHNPHGSNIAGMLHTRDPILCNQCHTPHTIGGVGAVGGQPGVFPPAVPPQTRSAVTPLSSGINTVNIWQGRSCLNCHTQVHGSNNPAARAPAPANLFR
ncbi:MAG TPA: DmsE family decaheme c-type cytochrome [Burkholderiaceae bacterium]|nr:DmsE family decaheme c-type cytochrome [Burkholderiaceae bacterium]